jgi:hypothetical protein
MASNKGGAPASAGTTDTRVDRPEEGLPGVANVANPTANPPTRATFEAGKATGYRRPKPRAVIDTTQTSGLTPDQDIKRGEPASW